MYIIPKGLSGISASYPYDKKTSVLHIIVTEKINFFREENLVFKGKEIIDTNITKTPIISFTDTPWLGFRRDNEILIMAKSNILIK